MITGEKVILRPVRIEDREYTVKWRNDLFIKASTLAHPFPITDEVEKEWYELNIMNKSNNFLPFTIVEKETGKVVGFASLSNINWISRIAFISTVIGDGENIGKGMGREAQVILVRYAFDFLNLTKVCGYCRADHPALKTWKETGVVIEGTLSNHFFANGRYYDVYFISWIKENVEAVRNKAV